MVELANSGTDSSGRHEAFVACALDFDLRVCDQHQHPVRRAPERPHAKHGHYPHDPRHVACLQGGRNGYGAQHIGLNHATSGDRLSNAAHGLQRKRLGNLITATAPSHDNDYLICKHRWVPCRQGLQSQTTRIPELADLANNWPSLLGNEQQRRTTVWHRVANTFTEKYGEEMVDSETPARSNFERFEKLVRTGLPKLDSSIYFASGEECFSTGISFQHSKTENARRTTARAHTCALGAVAANPFFFYILLSTRLH